MIQHSLLMENRYVIDQLFHPPCSWTEPHLIPWMVLKKPVCNQNLSKNQPELLTSALQA